MYIIVVGGGEAGYYIARTLLNNGHEVLIIESNTQRCNIISENLGNIVIRGDGCEAATLDEVGTNRADVLIAITGDDEDNMVACQVAKHKFNVPRTIARLKNPKHETLFRKLGVDVTVSSTNLVLANIKRELPDNPLCSLLAIKGGSLEVIDVKIPVDSPVSGKVRRHQAGRFGDGFRRRPGSVAGIHRRHRRVGQGHDHLRLCRFSRRSR